MPGPIAFLDAPDTHRPCRTFQAPKSANKREEEAARRAKIIGLMVEGNSLRAISRLCDVSINTVTKLLVDIGQRP